MIYEAIEVKSDSTEFASWVTDGISVNYRWSDMRFFKKAAQFVHLCSAFVVGNST